MADDFEVPSLEDLTANLRALDPSMSDDAIANVYRTLDKQANPRLYEPDFATFAGNMRAAGVTADDDALRQQYEKAYPFSTWEAFGSGLATGMYGLAQSTAGLLDMAGANETAADLKQFAEAGIRRNAPRPGTVDNLAENPWRIADPRTWAYGAGSVLPSATSTMVPGGLAFRAAGGMAALQAGSKAPMLAAAGAGGLAGGAMEAGPAYYNALEQGMSPEAARTHALKFGAAVAVLNAIPVGTAFASPAAFGRWGRAGRALGTGIGEAVTEVAEGPTEAYLLGEDMWDALKAEADVAPGALLAGALFGGVGSPSGTSPKALPEVPPGAGGTPGANQRPAGTGNVIQGTFADNTLDTLNQVPQTVRMEQRAQEAAEAQEVLSTDEAFTQQEAQQREQRSKEEEIAWSRHLAQTEMPVYVKQSLVKAEVERAYQERAPSAMEEAFAASLPPELPQATRDAALASARATGALQATSTPDLRPMVEPTETGAMPTPERLGQLQSMVDTGRPPPSMPTLYEEQLLNRAHMAMASGDLPAGVAIRREQSSTGEPQFTVEQNGVPVGSYPTNLGANVAAQALPSAPGAPVTITEVEEARLPSQMPFAGVAQGGSRARSSTGYIAGLLDRSVFASIRETINDLPVQDLSLFSNYVVEAIEGQSTGKAILERLSVGQAKVLTSLIDTMAALGVPRGALSALDGMMAMTPTGEARAAGVHMQLSTGQRVIAMDSEILNRIGMGMADEAEYLSAVYTLTHEVGHLVGNNYALADPRMQPGGAIYEELHDAYKMAGGPLSAELKYPFYKTGDLWLAERVGTAEDAASLRRTLTTEAMAQLFAVHYVFGPEYRQFIADNVPMAHSLMQEVSHALMAGTARERGDRLLRAFRLRDPAVAGAEFDAGPIARVDYDGAGDGRATGTSASGAVTRDRGSQLLRPVNVEEIEQADGADGTVGDRAGLRARGYGVAREGSTQVTAVHYSPQTRETLDSSFYGKGKKGAEQARLSRPSANPDVYPRIFFYVDEGRGVRPESGVGAKAHEIKLNNVYDVNADPLGLTDQAYDAHQDNNDAFNALESLVVANGFDGLYVSRAFGTQGAVILLGDHKITIDSVNDLPSTTAEYWQENNYKEVKGKKAGMPNHIQTRADVTSLVNDWLTKLDNADPRMLNRDDYAWYERVGEHIRLITHGNRDEMERMVRILALLSSDDTVENNTNAWVRSAYELMAWQRSGRPLEEFGLMVGRYPKSNARYIRAAMAAPQFDATVSGVGHKVMNFYRNLHDASFNQNQYPNAATIDRWMLWAFGFPTTVKSAGSKSAKYPMNMPAKYRYGMDVLREITDRYNTAHGTTYLPRQIQAAIRTLQMNQQRARDGLKPVHEDYVKTLEDATQTVTGETIPSVNSGLDGFIMSLPYRERKAFTNGAARIIMNGKNENELARLLKLPFYTDAQQIGGYAGDVNPNLVFSPVALKTNGTYDKTIAEVYARALQVIYQQDAVPWMRFTPNMQNNALAALKNDMDGPTLGIVLTTKGSMSPAQGRRLLENLKAAGIQDPGFTRISSNKVLVANWAWQKKFLDTIDPIVGRMKKRGTLVDAAYVGIEGNYGHTQDWATDPAGNGAESELRRAIAQAYTLSGAERGHLQRWIRDRRDAFAEYATEYKGRAGQEITIDEVSEDLGWRTEDPQDNPYVGSINLNHLRTREQVEQYLREGWRDNQDVINERRRHTRSWGHTEAAARTLGMTVENFLATPLGQAQNAETIEWARMVLESQAMAVRQASQAYMAMPSDENKVAVESERLKLTLIQSIYSGIVSEAGRALNILRKQSQDMRDMLQLSKELDHAGFTVEDYAAMVTQLEETGQVVGFTREADQPKFSDKALEVWINFLLSGPQTQATNVLSNTVVSLFSNLEMLAAAGIGKLTGSQAVTFKQAGAYASGTLAGAMAGLKAGQRAFVTEEGSGQYKIDVRKYQSIDGPLGRTVRIPGRLLLAGDEFFKGVAKGQMLRMLAMEQAEEQVRQHGGDVHKIYEEFVANPTEGMQQQMQEWADIQTYTNRLGEFGQSFQRLAATHPLLRVIFPFIRTPLNIVKFAFKRNLLLAPLFKDVREDLKGMHGKKRRDMAASRILVGTGISALIAQFVAQGLITGGGPDDPKERNAKYADGWQPYSFLIGDTYYSYARMEPLGILLGVASDAVEISEAWGDVDGDEIAALLVQSISNNLTSKTFLRGLSEMVEVLSDPTRYGDRYIQNLAGTVIPTLSAQVTRANDPYLREVRSITDKIRSRIPGESYSLPYRYDILGRKIALEGSAGPDLLSPIYISQIQNNPVIGAMKEADYFPGMPGKKIHGLELPPAVYAEYARMANGMAAKTLETLVQTPWFRSLPKSQRADMISDAYSRARRQARNYLLSRPEHQGLVREMIALQQAEAMAM